MLTFLSLWFHSGLKSSKYGEKALKILSKGKSVLKFAGKALPIISFGVDVVMLGLSIHELATHETAVREWQTLSANLTDGTKKIQDLVNLIYHFKDPVCYVVLLG